MTKSSSVCASSLPPTHELETVRKGGKPALAQALASLERHPDSPANLDLLSRAHQEPKAHIIGITGPPGVGKSTLIGKMSETLRHQNYRLGIIAIDPSSQASRGALLGDRIRLPAHPEDDGLYMRSMAARDRLGGIASLTAPATILMRALFDIVLIETVGVGQSEIEIADICDSVVLCIQPGSGDSLQFMKAGIAEIPDILVITKSDMGGVARSTAADIRSALKISPRTQDPLTRESIPEEWPVRLLSLSATRDEGIEALVTACMQHAKWLGLSGNLEKRRTRQDRHWLKERIREEFGRHGLQVIGEPHLAIGKTPFEQFATLRKKILKERKS